MSGIHRPVRLRHAPDSRCFGLELCYGRVLHWPIPDTSPLRTCGDQYSLFFTLRLDRCGDARAPMLQFNLDHKSTYSVEMNSSGFLSVACVKNDKEYRWNIPAAQCVLNEPCTLVLNIDQGLTCPIQLDWNGRRMATSADPIERSATDTSEPRIQLGSHDSGYSFVLSFVSFFPKLLDLISTKSLANSILCDAKLKKSAFYGGGNKSTSISISQSQMEIAEAIKKYRVVQIRGLYYIHNFFGNATDVGCSMAPIVSGRISISIQGTR